MTYTYTNHNGRIVKVKADNKDKLMEKISKKYRENKATCLETKEIILLPFKKY